ncbi:HAMP domain-containing histidine kinase [Trichocoleus desertorum]|uniref:histidine kinase n=1 Tax=Trichocoleus desertorum GB2-A4 TaxID=2933944 RepID=A0ABV0J6L2_9CYAN|nr:HAMP domain-containing histidine kinase [Trichocoleus sp. FACHB-46]
MHQWLLPSLSEVLAKSASNEVTNGVTSARETHDETHEVSVISAETSRNHVSIARQQVRAEREWWGAIAALNVLLEVTLPELAEPVATVHSPRKQHSVRQAKQGLILAGPSCILTQPSLNARLASWVFTPKALDAFAWMPFQLPPASSSQEVSEVLETTPALPVLPGDPLAAEQFCLVLTSTFSLVMVLGEKATGAPAFSFSFDPEVVQSAWRSLRPRALLTSPHQVERLDALVAQFAPTAPHYKTVMQFSQLLLQHLPDPIDLEAEALNSSRLATHSFNSETVHLVAEPFPELAMASVATTPMPSEVHAPAEVMAEPKSNLDVELLQAIAHEVRTPLTTIRTLTRLLLKRKDLAPEVLKRLEIIDRECNEQIDRFGLIFRAVELETSAVKRPPVALASTSIDQVLQQSIPRWEKQASLRNLTLKVLLPQKMPMVVSDPTMLDQALTSLIERFTRNLPGGSHIQVQVMLAGSQLKLQLQSELQPETDPSTHTSHSARSALKSIGQLLMFQPETGSLSLSLGVTKNLFQALGGKLIVREKPQQGEVMTIFLPLEVSHS